MGVAHHGFCESVAVSTNPCAHHHGPVWMCTLKYDPSGSGKHLCVPLTILASNVASMGY
jgi:hypothetical protein